MEWISGLFTTLAESGHALKNLQQLRVCSRLIANPPAPLSAYESAVIKQEEAVSWKLWLGSFGVYVGVHQSLARLRFFRPRPLVPQFIAIIPAVATIVAGGALFRQRTLERIANPPLAAAKEATLMNEVRRIYPMGPNSGEVPGPE